VKAKRFIRSAVALSLCLLLAATDWARAAEGAAAIRQADGDATAIEEFTGRFLFEEIDLERFFTRYRAPATKEPYTRYLGYFPLQQAAAALFGASNVVNVQQTGQNLRTPEKVSISALKGADVRGLVGTVIGGASSGLELCSNGLAVLKNRLKRIDPESTRLYETEGRVLRYFRDWALYECADIYAEMSCTTGI